MSTGGIKRTSKTPGVRSAHLPVTADALYEDGLCAESHYVRMFKASPSERIDIIRKGIPAETLVTAYFTSFDHSVQQREHPVH